MIESEQNPKVKLARSLQRRREREREGKVFIEGARLVEDALASGVPPHLLFYTESALGSERIAALVERWRSAAWAVSESIMQGLAGTVTPQGIAAIVPLPSLPWPPAPTLLLVVDRIRDPGNLGTLLRSAAATGVEGVLVPRGTVDPWNDKVLRAGMGAHFRLPLRDGLTWTEVNGFLEGLTVRRAEATGGLRYDRADWRVPCALIIGGEARGASEAAALRTDEIVSIPMANEVESLNAAMAGTVILFEAARQRRHSNRQETSAGKQR